jgi:hypothetical protein
MPDDSNRTVFNNGTPKGLIINSLSPMGGQTEPAKIEGDKLRWKNAQKNEKKNMISEIMNKTMPTFSPYRISSV